MRRFTGAGFWAIVSAFLVPLSALAQNLPDAIRLQERLLRQEGGRLENLAREDWKKALKPPLGQPQQELPTPKVDTTCISVKTISVEGGTVFSFDDMRMLVEPFEDSCLTKADIQSILNAINERYQAAGFVTSRAFLPEQTRTDGGLLIQIIEGRISAISFKDTPDRGRTALYFAFPSKAGDLLNIRDIEQGLDQLNRLPSNDAKIEISPARRAGMSRIDVSNIKDKGYRITSSRDNSGSKETGAQQNSLSFALDNPLDVNDAWSFFYRRSALVDRREKRNESFALNVTVPFGYWTARYSGSYYRYSALYKAPVQNFIVSGTLGTNNLSISRLIHRNQSSKTALGLRLAAENSKNYIEDTLVKNNSRKLSSASFDLSHSRRQWEGVLFASFGYTHGLRWLGALEDDPAAKSDAPKAQFRKLRLDASYSRPFDLAGEAFVWRSDLSSSYSPDILFSSARFSIGGTNSVRGFKDENLAGDQGYFIKNELSWTAFDAASWWCQKAGDLFGETIAYIGYDQGQVNSHIYTALNHGILSGLTIGLRNKADHFTYDLSFSRALSAPAILKEKGKALLFTLKLAF